MSDQFVEAAKASMGAVERLLKGLPGIGGYIDKELRREADKRVRDAIALALEQSKAELTALQGKLLKGGGLRLMDDVDQVSVKLQTLIDRVKTASYGYAGLFDAVRIKENQLDALHRFDVALAEQVGAVNGAIAGVAKAVSENANVEAAIEALGAVIAELHDLFDRRKEAIIAPDLLESSGFAPDVTSDPGAVG